jgi:glutamyl-tRNA reductase
MEAHDVVFFAVRAAQPILDATTIASLPSRAVWIDLGAPPVVQHAIDRSDVRYMSLTMLHATLRSEPDRLRLGRDAVESEVARHVAELHRRASRAVNTAAAIAARA